jgi:DNA-binding response OmpR family regulator/tetratricopeptide (TPR) repeat protein
MQKSDILVVIVDDDPNFGKSIEEAVQRAGYRTQLFRKPDEALSFAKLNSAQLYIIDCMLPKMNGVDLAAKLKDSGTGNDAFILMSGIYKDKGFIKNSAKKINALEFLIKPFDITQLTQIINDLFFEGQDSPTSPLYEIMAMESVSSRTKIKTINYSENVHGYDLPWVFALLMDERISGYLTIVFPDGEVTGVGFKEGQIVQVNLKDAQSYFGSLLIEKGFINSIELEQLLKETDEKKRIGERLVESNLISPHAIDIVVSDQLGIRLSKLVQDQSVTINFNKSNEVQIEARCEANQFSELLESWIDSKISLNWLKSLYLSMENYPLKKGPSFSLSHRTLNLPWIARFPNLIKEMTSGQETITSLLNKGVYPEESFYRALHLLILQRLIIFDKKINTVDYASQMKRLSNLEADLEKKNFFERLGLSPTAKDSEIKRVYHEMAKALHPDTDTTGMPKELIELKGRVFEKIQAAYDTLKNKASREAYIKELEHGRAEFVLKADSLTEQGRGFLQKSNFVKAYECFKEAAKLCPPNPELKMLLLWGQIKTEPKEKLQEELTDLQARMREIPPEDRHSALFFLVKGLVQKVGDQFEDAEKSFNHSLHQDPGFIHARRELGLLKSEAVEKTKSVDIFKSDLKDVVGLLFKKKK